MGPSVQRSRRTWLALPLAAVVLASGCGTMGERMGMGGGGTAVTLSGSQEVPSVSTNASGRGTITVKPDRTVAGSITTTGVVATAAHIHMAASGQNGPVIVPLTRQGDNGWVVPPGAQLTEAQYSAFQAGNLYINVHSAANPGGEIRGQLRPGR